MNGANPALTRTANRRQAGLTQVVDEPAVQHRGPAAPGANGVLSAALERLVHRAVFLRAGARDEQGGRDLLAFSAQPILMSYWPTAAAPHRWQHLSAAAQRRCRGFLQVGGLTLLSSPSTRSDTWIRKARRCGGGHHRGCTITERIGGRWSGSAAGKAGGQPQTRSPQQHNRSAEPIKHQTAATAAAAAAAEAEAAAAGKACLPPRSSRG